MNGCVSVYTCCNGCTLLPVSSFFQPLSLSLCIPYTIPLAYAAKHLLKSVVTGRYINMIDALWFTTIIFGCNNGSSCCPLGAAITRWTVATLDTPWYHFIIVIDCNIISTTAAALLQGSLLQPPIDKRQETCRSRGLHVVYLHIRHSSFCSGRNIHTVKLSE